MLPIPFRKVPAKRGFPCRHGSLRQVCQIREDTGKLRFQTLWHGAFQHAAGIERDAGRRGSRFQAVSPEQAVAGFEEDRIRPCTDRVVDGFSVHQNRSGPLLDENALIQMGIVVQDQTREITAPGIRSELAGRNPLLGKVQVHPEPDISGRNCSDAAEGDDIDLLDSPERGDTR